ncbi:MAG: ATP-dependent nuclease [Saprospiraceae bacterium]
MYIREFRIINFKSFEEVSFSFNHDVNIFTGTNNSGKTTVLEAISLWHECFGKLIQQARRATKNYRSGDFVLGNTQNKYFPFDQINSVRSPNFEDIFFQRDGRKKITLLARITDAQDELEIGFTIGESGLNYVIELMDHVHYDYQRFNRFFKNLPNPVALFKASPVSSIRQVEDFTTDPNVTDAITNRESATVLRNRLYRLYHHPNSQLFPQFINDLSFILSQDRQRFQISTESNIQKDKRVVFNFMLGPKDIPKDIALLGSGSLQIIEILLNLYSADNLNQDLHLILLDEPDSHIHRDIQQRLLTTLKRFSSKNQIFISTHNEAFIRSADLSYLFHLDINKSGVHYNSIGSSDLAKQRPRFGGLYPSRLYPVVHSLNDSTGLDFIDAIEADRILFVEGEDDARVIDHLLRVSRINNTQKYAFWVLGGISHVLKDILSYKTVFSAIKNNKSLWDKAVLIFDRDWLNDRDKNSLPSEFEKSMGLKTYLWNAYTIESTLMTNLTSTSRLLSKWLAGQGKTITATDIESNLVPAYQSIARILEERLTNDFYEKVCYFYKNLKDKTSPLFGKESYHWIKENSVQLNTLVRNHLQACIDSGEWYKLMTKEDTGKVIYDALQPFSHDFDIEKDFFGLIKSVDRSVWMDEWNFLTEI